MARYWLRIRAEYVVPVLATSADDARELDTADLVDELTPERLYSSEVIGAVADSERKRYPTVDLELDTQQQREHDYDIAAARMTGRIRERFARVSTSNDSILRSIVISAIGDLSNEVAKAVLGKSAECDDRRRACAQKLRDNAEKIAGDYIEWRTKS